MNYLSTNLKFLRQYNNLTQEEIANIVGKARSLVSAWESDERGMTTEDIIKLSDHFKIPMDDFVGKDLRIKNDNTFDELEMLFKKAKPNLSDDDKETMIFLMKKTINNYEKNKNN